MHKIRLLTRELVGALPVIVRNRFTVHMHSVIGALWDAPPLWLALGFFCKHAPCATLASHISNPSTHELLALALTVPSADVMTVRCPSP